MDGRIILPGVAKQLRLAELIAAISLATDLGMGQPLEQALRTCLVALDLAERLGLSEEEKSDTYYVSLLRFLGCTADAREMAEMVGGDEIAVRAAIAPVLGGKPNEFAPQVMPKRRADDHRSDRRGDEISGHRASAGQVRQLLRDNGARGASSHRLESMGGRRHADAVGVQAFWA
jgi:hypothetical protein